jgi:PAS domain S-box-containing protein
LDPRNTAEFIENQVLQIQAAIAELRTMRGFISDTLRQMADGLLVINSVGQILLTNNQAKSLLGCAAGEDLKGTDALELMEKLEIQNGIGWIKAFRDVLLDQKVVFMEARCLPGQELLIQISPLSIEQGSLHGMILLLSDISLLKQSERKRSEALHFLSHDLRSPITSLLSLVQMRNQEFSPFDPEEITERIEHYAKKALQLAEDFLQMARAENADQLNFQETDLVTIAHNAMDEAYIDADRRDVKLMRHMEVDEAWIRADPGLLERALMNLLKNAIYYSSKGSIVTLSISVNKTEVSCCVQDRGQGIAPEELDRIFEPFQRVQDNDPTRPRGTGIGLAFVKVVASKHQGSIEVKSTPGEGSLFCLKLPYGSNREPS